MMAFPDHEAVLNDVAHDYNVLAQVNFCFIWVDYYVLVSRMNRWGVVAIYQTRLLVILELVWKNSYRTKIVTMLLKHAQTLIYKLVDSTWDNQHLNVQVEAGLKQVSWTVAEQ